MDITIALLFFHSAFFPALKDMADGFYLHETIVILSFQIKLYIINININKNVNNFFLFGEEKLYINRIMRNDVIQILSRFVVFFISRDLRFFPDAFFTLIFFSLFNM